MLYFLLFLYIDSCLLFYIASQIVNTLPTIVVRATTIAIAIDGRAIDIDKVVMKKKGEKIIKRRLRAITVQGAMEKSQ